jgi:hypothetical protein
MIERLQTVALVSIVTLLIWAFAEVQSLRSADLPIKVRIDRGSESRLIRVLDESWADSVDAQVEGANALVDDVEEQINQAVVVAAPQEPGTHTLDLRDVLRRSDVFDRSGVTIVAVDPPTLRIQVVEIAETELPIVVTVPAGQVDGPPVPTPAIATLRYPADAGIDLADATIAARIGVDRLTDLTPGRAERVTGVRLEPPADLAGLPGVRVDPAQAEITLTLRSTTESVVVPSVPVRIDLALVEAGNWIVEPDSANDRFLRDVRVTGPSDVVKRIETGDLRVPARVVLSFSELEDAVSGDGTVEKEVTFGDLPSQIRFEADDRVIRLRVTRRAPGGE